MQQAFFLFKFIEMCFGISSMIYHIIGFTRDEPLVHNLFYCGTFFGYTLYTLIGMFSIWISTGPTIIVEGIINGCAAVMYIGASMLSMYHAEMDFHLMYLSDFEEPLHGFFRYSKSQSIVALAAGLLHLIHTFFCLDVVLVTEEYAPVPLEGTDVEPATQPLKLYVFGKICHTKLEEYEWFRRLDEDKTLKDGKKP